LAPASELRAVAELTAHPAYDAKVPTDAYGLGPVNDIGVVLLEAPIPDAVVAPVLPSTEIDGILVPNRPLHIVGFGIHDTSSQASGTLHKAITPLVRHTDTELLAGRPGEPDVCFGDSGGPAYVVDNGTLWLVGATSRVWEHASQPCGEASVYTMVPFYVSWIVSLAGEIDGGVTDGGFAGGGWDAAQGSDAARIDGNPSCVPLDGACHPVTNEGCDAAAGEACRFDPTTSSVACAPAPNDVGPAEICDQTSRFCMPGFYCGASLRCEKLCCSDADCPSGVTCDPLISLLGNLGTCGPVDVEIDAGPEDAAADAAADAPPEAGADTGSDALPEAAVDAQPDAGAMEAGTDDGGVDAGTPADGGSTDGEPGPPEAIDPSGGCACSASGNGRGHSGALLAALGLLGWSWRRRRSATGCPVTACGKAVQPRSTTARRR